MIHSSLQCWTNKIKKKNPNNPLNSQIIYWHLKRPKVPRLFWLDMRRKHDYLTNIGVAGVYILVKYTWNWSSRNEVKCPTVVSVRCLYRHISRINIIYSDLHDRGWENKMEWTFNNCRREREPELLNTFNTVWLLHPPV